MKINKGSALLLLIVLLTFAMLVLAPQPQVTQAGTNGQQIRFDCASMNSAIVRGNNQNGSAVEWKQNSSGYFVTSGYWWIGWVRIYYWNRNTNTWRSVSVNVPKIQSYSDIFYARC